MPSHQERIAKNYGSLDRLPTAGVFEPSKDSGVILTVPIKQIEKDVRALLIATEHDYFTPEIADARRRLWRFLEG